MMDIASHDSKTMNLAARQPDKDLVMKYLIKGSNLADDLYRPHAL